MCAILQYDNMSPKIAVNASSLLMILNKSDKSCFLSVFLHGCKGSPMSCENCSCRHDGCKPTVAKPTLAKPSQAKPTLVNSILCVWVLVSWWFMPNWRRPSGRRGSHKITPEKPKRALWVGHGLEPRPQFHEKTPRDGRKNDICGARGQEKSEILSGLAEGLQRRGGVAEGPQKFGPKVFLVGVAQEEKHDSPSRTLADVERARFNMSPHCRIKEMQSDFVDHEFFQFVSMFSFTEKNVKFEIRHTNVYCGHRKIILSFPNWFESQPHQRLHMIHPVHH